MTYFFTIGVPGDSTFEVKCLASEFRLLQSVGGKDTLLKRGQGSLNSIVCDRYKQIGSGRVRATFTPPERQTRGERIPCPEFPSSRPDLELIVPTRHFRHIQLP